LDIRPIAARAAAFSYSLIQLWSQAAIKAESTKSEGCGPDVYDYTLEDLEQDRETLRRVNSNTASSPAPVPRAKRLPLLEFMRNT
jgi:hypothetical protein